MPDAISLNQRARHDDDYPEPGEFVEDRGISAAAEDLAREAGPSGLGEEIRRLPERHRQVLIRRYGATPSSGLGADARNSTITDFGDAP